MIILFSISEVNFLYYKSTHLNKLLFNNFYIQITFPYYPYSPIISQKNAIFIHHSLQALIEFFSSYSCQTLQILNITKPMISRTKKKLSQNVNYYTAILFVGLLLSQTQILVNLKGYSPISPMPIFTLIYFATTTLYLIYLFLSYAFWSKYNKGVILQLYENIMLPLSVFLITLLSHSPRMIYVKALSSILLAIQSLIVCAKIIYFNSVSSELAQISTINKLIRVVKLNIIALLPLLVSSELVMVIIVAVCQALSVVAFFLKFTYQKCVYEYILSICVFCGGISAIQNVFQTIFNMEYLFIGQISCFVFYFTNANFVKQAVQQKYVSSLLSNTQNKQDDQILAGLLFINQSLFDCKTSFCISPPAKNEGVVQARILLERSNNSLPNEDDLDKVYKIKDKASKREILSELFQVYCNRFYQTDSYSSFQFTVNIALELGSHYTNKALILYYGFIERKKGKLSTFEQCKFNSLYLRIIKQVNDKEGDRKDIKFIEFSDKLKVLGEDIEEVLSNELKLSEYLFEGRRSDYQIQAYLVRRNKIRRKIEMEIQNCIDNKIYFNSNQFKFLYLLYYCIIHKRYESIKDKLKRYFIKNHTLALSELEENSIIILSGFNHGEIINSNQIFKNQFNINLNSFSKSNISEFIPSEKQKAKHSALMISFVQFKSDRSTTHHGGYECLLSVERQLNGVKAKIIQKYGIGVRIYHQNQKGFNYICSLTREKHEATHTFTLLKHDCDHLTKGIKCTIRKQYEVVQLEETVKLCDIQVRMQNHSNVRINIKSNTNNKIQKGGKNKESYLQEKITNIQKKLLSNSNSKYQYSAFNIIEIILLLLLAFILFSIFFNLTNRIDNLATFIVNVLDPINAAELTHVRLFVEQEILSLQKQTPYFDDSLCKSAGISSIYTYVTNQLSKDLSKNADAFINQIYQLHDYGQLNVNIQARSYSSVPYMVNPKILISYQKHVQFMKIQAFVWLSDILKTSFSTYYYQQIFPPIMVNSALDSNTSLSLQMLKLAFYNQDSFAAKLRASISQFKILAFVSISLIGVAALLLRLFDNRWISRYLQMGGCLREEQLARKIRQVKSGISQVHQIRYNSIESIQVDSQLTIDIKYGDKQMESVEVEQFANWHQHSQSESRVYDQQIYDEEQKLMPKEGRRQYNQKQIHSQLLRILEYNKFYIILMLSLIVTLAVLTNYTILMQSNRVDTLISCSLASQQLNQLQQKFSNIIAYNWLKVYSLKAKFNITLARAMWSQALNSLYQSDYQAKMTEAYTKQLADTILFGEICHFFTNATLCEQYRNNIFSSGFTMIIPFVVKQEVEMDQFSSNASDYYLNLCDKTWLLFDGIIPATINIANYCFGIMNERVSKGFISLFVWIGGLIGSMVLMTVIVQRRRWWSQGVIVEQVLSLQRIGQLYSIEQFKPYFNHIYYS